jgi:hypothetical protein
LKSEVLGPFLLAWIEQRNKLARLRIDGSNIATFPRIATQASISEVLECGHSSVFPTNDVVYLVRRVRIIRVQEAVFTSMPRAFRNMTAKFV